MILLLDSSTPICKITLDYDNFRYEDEWQADRQLAKGLLGYLRDSLQKNGKDFADISGIGVLTGPGSFTGLRIGLTVLNTLADAQQIPIVGATGEDWQQEALRRLKAGENDQLVLPLYSSEPHITQPRK